MRAQKAVRIHEASADRSYAGIPERRGRSIWARFQRRQARSGQGSRRYLDRLTLTFRALRPRTAATRHCRLPNGRGRDGDDRDGVHCARRERLPRRPDLLEERAAAPASAWARLALCFCSVGVAAANPARVLPARAACDRPFDPRAGLPDAPPETGAPCAPGDYARGTGRDRATGFRDGRDALRAHAARARAVPPARALRAPSPFRTGSATDGRRCQSARQASR